MTDGQGNQVAFGSSWELRSKEGLYGIPAKQNVAVLESILMRTTAEQSFLPTRCGFNWEMQSASASNIEIKHITESEATAINEKVTVKGNTSSAMYNLNGVRTNGTKKGIYIQNGKKVIK